MPPDVPPPQTSVDDRVARLESEMSAVCSAIADVQTILAGRSAILASDHRRVTDLETWAMEQSEILHHIAERLNAVAIVLMPPGIPLFNAPPSFDPVGGASGHELGDPDLPIQDS